MSDERQPDILQELWKQTLLKAILVDTCPTVWTEIAFELLEHPRPVVPLSESMRQNLCSGKEGYQLLLLLKTQTSQKLLYVLGILTGFI